MKRKGHIWEELTNRDHCDESVLCAVENKVKTDYILHVKENYKEYGYTTQQILLNRTIM